MNVIKRGEAWQTKRLLPSSMYDMEHMRVHIGFSTNLRLVSNGVEIAVFKLGSGIGLEGQPPDRIILSTAVNDTQHWDAGEYQWTLDVYDDSDTLVLQENGEFALTDDPAEVTKPVKPWDFFRPSMHSISDVDVQARLAICRECPLFNGVLCTECNCIMEAKARLAPATCPLEKW